MRKYNVQCVVYNNFYSIFVTIYIKKRYSFKDILIYIIHRHK